MSRAATAVIERAVASDTVRGLFQEGAPLIAGLEIRMENHIQIVARQPAAIIGLFRPRGFTTWARHVSLEIMDRRHPPVVHHAQRRRPGSRPASGYPDLPAQ